MPRVRELSQPLAVVVLGPTASGKTELAVELARRLGGEVVNFDSRQLYRGLEIGTGKPGIEARRAVPHHLFDLADATETVSAAQFARQARSAVEGILARGHVPILCGGTGLYLRALLVGLSGGPARSETTHRRLERIADRGGLGRLAGWLARVDPVWAARIGKNDRQRILRGLDVWLQTGRPLSAHFATGVRPALEVRALRLGIDWSREELYRRIDARVDEMLAAGWLEEVRGLATRPGFAASNAAKALGYRDLLAVAEGRQTLAVARERIRRDTRRLAKRQLTWFRREPEVHWLPAEPLGTLADRASALVRPRFFGLLSRIES